MMNRSKTILIFVVALLISLLISSCSSGGTTDVPAETVEGEVAAETTEEEPTDAGNETESEVTETEESSATGENLPEDVPLMPGYRNLLVTSDGSNLSYEIDGTIDDVVTFYQEELANMGWEMTRSPDNAYSNFGSMARTNEAGDRVTFSLQHNPVGQFTVVRIVVLRAP